MKDHFNVSIFEAVTFIILVFLFIYYQKRQQNSILRRNKEKAIHEKEIHLAKIELQNAMLKFTGQELQSNIGQLLSVTKINLCLIEAGLEATDSDGFVVKFQQTIALISQIIDEVRNLSNSLDKDFVQDFNLREYLMEELRHIRRLKNIVTHFESKGKIYSLGNDREIMLFRLAQEILSIILKNSEVKQIEIKLHYFHNNFAFIIYHDIKCAERSENTIEFEPSKHCNCFENINRRAASVDFDCKKVVRQNLDTKYYLTTGRGFTV